MPLNKELSKLGLEGEVSTGLELKEESGLADGELIGLLMGIEEDEELVLVDEVCGKVTVRPGMVLQELDVAVPDF